METNRVIAVTWPSPENPPPALLLESILLEAKRSGRYDPFVVDVPSLLTAMVRPPSSVKVGLDRFVKTYGAGEIPVLSPDSLADCLTELGRKKQTRLLKGKDFFILTNGAEAKALGKLTQTLWVFLTPDTLTAASMYRLLGLYPGEDLTLYLWMVGVASLEKAAEIFAKLKEELSSLRKDYFTLILAGSCSLDAARVEMARAFRKPLIDTFPGDSLHGSILFGLKRADSRSDPAWQSTTFVEIKKELGALLSHSL